MDITSFIVFLVVGAVAGWLAGLIMRGAGFGLLGNIIVGILGSVVGGWLFGSVFKIAIGISPVVDATIYALVGAIVLLFVIGLFRKKGAK